MTRCSTHVSDCDDVPDQHEEKRGDVSGNSFHQGLRGRQLRRGSGGAVGVIAPRAARGRRGAHVLNTARPPPAGRGVHASHLADDGDPLLFGRVSWHDVD